MSLICFLLFLLPFSASGLYIDKDDEKALLKIKKQLGDPAILSSWVKGYDFCGLSTPSVVVSCNDNGRIGQFIVHDTNITAPFPDAICDLSDLNIFVLSKLPGFYGPIPSCVTKLNVVFFIVQETSLSGPIPSFYNSTEIIEIILSNNQLSGTIPSSLSTLPNLQVLDLSSNHLTGTLSPVHLLRYPFLLLSHNNLSGEIPKSYGSIDLKLFDVGYNNFSGDASFLFGKEKNTSNIMLANNNFEFDLSYVEFSDSLTDLDLSHNKIYGKVPDSFATAGGLRLRQPNLSCNRLCGELPQGYNMQFFKAEDFADNACLCGSPLPPCSNSAPAAAPIYTPPF